MLDETDTATDVAKPNSEDKATRKKAKDATGDTKSTSDRYVLPVVGVHIPAMFVEVGFWGGLVGAVALGVVDPPLAIVVGAGVVIARHTAKK